MLNILHKEGRKDIIGKLRDITKEEMITFGYNQQMI
jgi:hypothetical protein